MRLPHNQSGQSMIAYAVAVAFGILLLSTGPVHDIIFNDLIPAITGNSEGFSYSVSLSDYPDSSDQDAANQNLYDPETTEQQAMLEELQGYTSETLPDLAPGMERIERNAGLSPSDFLEGVNPN